jgi:hypothetical protein
MRCIVRSFILGFILGGAALYGSMCFHVVRTEDGYHFVPKTALTVRDSYVDIRSFDIGAWREHVPLAEAIMKAGKSELMHGAAESAVQNALENLLDRQRR